MKYYLLILTLCLFVVSCSKEDSKEKVDEFRDKLNKKIKEIMTEDKGIGGKDSSKVVVTKEEKSDEIVEIRPRENQEEKVDSVKKTAETTQKIIDKPVEEKKEKVVATKPVKTEKVQTKKTPQKGNSKAQLWADYRKYRTEGENLKKEKKYLQSIEAFISAGKATEQLERFDLASWQYNNAGKHAIDAFKERTSFEERYGKLNRMKKGKEKDTYYSEIQQLIAQEYHFIEKAYTYLQKAEALNALKKDNRRTSVIESNKRFVNLVKSRFKR